MVVNGIQIGPAARMGQLASSPQKDSPVHEWIFPTPALCLAWTLSPLCLLHSLSSSSTCFLPPLPLPKCQIPLQKPELWGVPYVMAQSAINLLAEEGLNISADQTDDFQLDALPTVTEAHRIPSPSLSLSKSWITCWSGTPGGVKVFLG